MKKLLKSARFQIGAAILLVIMIYGWFFTAGWWITLPNGVYTNMYDQLATGFCRGQLHLASKPPATLLNLADPYDPRERTRISYLGDASLYDGQYYLYWGPVPAAVLCGIKIFIYGGEIGDEYFVFVPIAGLMVSLALLAYEIQKKFFGDLPIYLLLFGILVAGLANPFTWMLNSPDIYEAGIACGQFFLITGIYWIFVGLKDPPRPGLAGIFLGAICLALAIGSRFTQVLPAAVITIMTLAWYYRDCRPARPKKELLALLLILIAPQLITIAALGWYNYARFGSFSEFGLRYQLAFVDMHKAFNSIFSPLYILPNLYNYLLNPFIAARQFPYLLPQYGRIFRNFPLPLPRLYFSEAITGMLFVSPVVCFAIYGLIARLTKDRRHNSGSPSQLQRLELGLALAAAANIAVLLCFFDAAERYSVEMIGPLIPLILIGVWEGYVRLADRPVWRRVYLALTLVLGGISILNSSLLAISSVQDRFFYSNPALMERITNLLLH